MIMLRNISEIKACELVMNNCQTCKSIFSLTMHTGICIEGLV